MSYFPTKHAVGIVIHNTQYPNRAPYDAPEQERQAEFENARVIQRDHFSRGWSDTGQHFTISQGGVITEGRHGTLEAAKAGCVVRGAHAPGANDDRWGIEIAGDNQAAYVVTPQQWSALVDLSAWLSRLAGVLPLEIQPHKHFNNTNCPGKITDKLDDIRKAVKDRSGA